MQRPHFRFFNEDLQFFCAIKQVFGSLSCHVSDSFFVKIPLILSFSCSYFMSLSHNWVRTMQSRMGKTFGMILDSRHVLCRYIWLKSRYFYVVVGQNTKWRTPSSRPSSPTCNVYILHCDVTASTTSRPITIRAFSSHNVYV